MPSLIQEFFRKWKTRLFIEKTSEKLEKFDFLSQEIKLKKLEKTCNLSVFFDIFRDRLYPPFDFQNIFTRGSSCCLDLLKSFQIPPIPAPENDMSISK